MKAYLVANVTETDRDGYERYRQQVTSVLEQYGGKFLVRSGTIHPKEGDFGFHRLVIIEFPSMEAANRFYDSPEYQPLLELRTKSATSQVALVEGAS